MTSFPQTSYLVLEQTAGRTLDPCVPTSERRTLRPTMRVVGLYKTLVAANAAALSRVVREEVSCKIAALDVVEGSPLLLRGDDLQAEGLRLVEKGEQSSRLVQEVIHPLDKEPPVSLVQGVAARVYFYRRDPDWLFVRRWIKTHIAEGIAALEPDPLDEIPQSKENDAGIRRDILFLTWQAALNGNDGAHKAVSLLLSALS